VLEATPAQPAEGYLIMSENEIRLTLVEVIIPPDPLAKLPALAERLGVKPRRPEDPPSVLLQVRGGEQFDLFDIVRAALGRLDRTLRRALPKLEEVVRTLPRPVKPVTLSWGSGRDLPTGAEFEAIVREVLRPSGQVPVLADVSTQAQTCNKSRKMNMAAQA